MKLKAAVLALALCVSPHVTQADAPPMFIKSFPAPGSPSFQLNNPKGLGVDATGNVYVADSGNNRIIEFTGNGDYVRDFTGGGGISHPIDIAFGPDGKIYVSQGFILYVFDSDFNYLATWTGHFGSLAIDPTGLFLYSTYNIYMYKYQLSDGAQVGGWQYTSLASPAGGFGVGPSSTIYVPAEGLVYKYSGDGAFLGSIDPGSQGTGGLVVDSDEHFTTAVDDSILRRYTGDGVIVWDVARPVAGLLYDIDVDASGNYFLLSNGNTLVYKFGSIPTSIKTSSWGNLKRRYR